MRLSRRDLELAFEFVHSASSANAAEPFTRTVVESFGELVPGDVVYYEWDMRSLDVPILEVPVRSTPDHVAKARRHFCAAYPLSVTRLSGASRPFILSDFVTPRALHRLEYYDHVLRPTGIEHQMRLWLPAPPAVSRVFYFNRHGADGDFGDRDRGLLALLRPFLAAMRERFDLRETRLPIEVDVLNEREAVILEWVARGNKNQEIATLGVHTRTAAVTRVLNVLGDESRGSLN